jgi:DNA-binding transcriptional MerR regulator
MTGIKAHTIRIWEKRFGLIQPSRSATNRRYYNSDQVRKLINIATLVGDGYKISAIAAMGIDDLNKAIETHHIAVPVEAQITNYVNDLILATTEFDEAAFERIFEKVRKQFGLVEGMVKVIYPFLRNAGVLWRVSRLLPVEEHFASCIIRRKLIVALDGIPRADPSKSRWLLFLPQGEWHELGLLLACYILRSKGHTCIYIGQDVPNSDLNTIIDSTLPDYLFTFYIQPRPVAEMKAHLTALTAAYPELPILVSGDHELFTGIQLENSQVKHLREVKDIFPFI